MTRWRLGLSLSGLAVALGLIFWLTPGIDAAWVEAIASVFAAVGTVAAVGLALYQLVRDRKERRQLERRAQAELVSAVYMKSGGADEQGPRVLIDVINNSQEPIYDVVAWAVYIVGAGLPHTGEEFKDGPHHHTACRHYGALPPGTWRVTVHLETGIMGARLGAEVGFTDRAGIHWIRRARGQLQDIPTDAIEHYGFSQPAPYQIPTRAP